MSSLVKKKPPCTTVLWAGWTSYKCCGVGVRDNFIFIEGLLHETFGLLKLPQTHELIQ